MTAALTLILLMGSSDVLSSLEARLEESFDDATYRRYLYYCRQQSEGARLAEQSEKWLESYPENQVLRFGRAEGLMMSGNEREGTAAFRELYRSWPAWSSEIIFTMRELGSDEVVWVIEEERKRIGDPTLHAHILVDYYLERNNPRKALAELSSALKAGEDQESYRREIAALSQNLGSQRVLAELKGSSPGLRFQLALQAGDKREMETAIMSSQNPAELSSMGSSAEQSGYLSTALIAYREAADKASQARILVALNRTNEAVELLSQDNSLEGKKQLAYLLSRSKQTYTEALKTLKEIERRYGSGSEWSTSIAAIEILEGDVASAKERLAGLPDDSTVLFLEAIVSAVQEQTDSIKRFVDISMVHFAGNDYENDLLILYDISLTGGAGLGEYAVALTAYHWGDAADAYERSAKLAQKDTSLADEALLVSAESLVQLGRWGEADEAYRKIYADWPKSPLVLRAKFERALLLRNHLNNPEEAARILEEIVRTAPASLYADYARREI